MEDKKKQLQNNYLEELAAIPSTYAQWFDTLPEEQQSRVRTQIARYKHGLHAVAPLTCFGPKKCPFFTACPIPKDTAKPGSESQYPIGLQCVLEVEFMVQKIAEYLLHLDVAVDNPVEVSLVNELALIDLQKNRALMVLSHGDTTGQGRDFMQVDESITGYSENGGALTSRTTKLHPAVEVINGLERRREKLLDKLMETRKAKADYQLKTGDAKVGSRVLYEIESLKTFVGKLVSGAEVLEITAEDDGIDLDGDPWESE